MASSNILLFDPNKQNLMTDANYNSNTYRNNGVQSGVASSSLQNKFQYQVSLVAYAIAQLMINNGKNSLDSDQVSTFVDNLSASILQKVTDKASTAQAQAATDDTKWMSPALVKSCIESVLWTKTDILADATKSLFGLTSSATPDDIFSWIGNFNKYWWERKSFTWIEDLNDASGSITYISPIQYSSQISIDDDGNISLVDPQSLAITGSSQSAQDLAALAPCYFKWRGSELNYHYLPAGSTGGTSVSNTIRWNSSSSKFEYGSTASVKCKNVNISISYGEEEFVNSTDINTYPDSGRDNGYEYNFVGQPLSNLPSMLKYETGSYIGTGVYGSGNENSITFSFFPKLVLIYSSDMSMFSPLIVGADKFYSGYFSGSTPYLYENTVSFSGNTMSWYSTGAQVQLNRAPAASFPGFDGNYHYVAIG